MRMRKLFAMASCLTILGFFLASRAPTAPTASPKQEGPVVPAAESAPAMLVPTTTPKPVSEQPRYGGILYVAHFGDPVTYDPIQEAIVQSLSLMICSYSGVVQHAPLEPTKVIGDLAEKWEMAPDGMSYTFQLHKNVKWHDGAPFTSEDVRFSLETSRKPPRGVTSPRQEWLKAVDKIETSDEDTLKITLQYPSASFIHNLADGRMVIVPKHVFEAKGSMKRDVVGTGPYKFKSFAPGTSWNVLKNTDYFIKGRPYLDGITWYIIPDVATRFAALRTHRVQGTPWGAQGLTATQSEIIHREMSDKIYTAPYSSLISLGFWMPHTRAPWNDLRVRRAVELTIDRPKVIKLAVEGGGEVAGYAPKGSWSLPDEELMKMPGYRQPKDQDIAEAKRLLAEAGFPGGLKTTTITRSGSRHMERSAVSIKEQLAQIGIDVTVKLNDPATNLDLLYKRNFDTAVYSSAYSYDDPDQFFGQAFLAGLPWNFSEFSDETFEKWYNEQTRELDPAKRKELVLRMQRRLFELVPFSMLFWTMSELGYWKEVKNLKPGIGNFNNLKWQDVWLAE